ncbi:hypothetical protein FOL88_08185 [Lactobacillus reuteri]|uniref:hypothetical protein n=1 Tax=Limosilactobacillus reuteri TaxID=1598 RepID=UPI00146D8CD6|nr:hypothetical protein [Limosilactobacillus reuteri]NMV54871.1 hypothetical protein [Limosilactobacillus reuteri]
MAVNLDALKKAYEEASANAEKATTVLNNANNTLSATQKALDEARNAQTAAADKLGTTNPDVAALQKAYDDATAKVNDATKSLEDAKTATKKAQDTFNQNNEFATDAAAAYNELKADHAENALNAAQAMLNKVQKV